MKEKGISPKDLTAPWYNVLGINPFQDYHVRQGRTCEVLDEGQVIRAYRIVTGREQPT